VRQFVAGVIIVPTLITILWFAVLGGSALYIELHQPGALTGEDGAVDLNTALFQMLQFIPGTDVLTFGVIILIGIFFITSADSGALVMGMIATGGQLEPPRWVRTFFTLTTSLLAVALLLTGGLVALQTAAIIIALPFSIVMLLICWSTVVAFARERRAYDRAARAQFVDHIGEYYGLEVEEPTAEGALREPAWMRRFARRFARRPAEGVAPTTAPLSVRHARPESLAAENAEPDGVPTGDVDDVLSHDPYVSRDADDIPDRTRSARGHDPLSGGRG
jgi:choline/glycine/proline betaine transport protein